MLDAWIKKNAIFYMFKFHRSYCIASLLNTLWSKWAVTFLQELLLEKFLKTTTIKLHTHKRTHNSHNDTLILMCLSLWGTLQQISIICSIVYESDVTVYFWTQRGNKSGLRCSSLGFLDRFLYTKFTTRSTTWRMEIHANMKTVHRNLAVLFIQMCNNIGKTVAVQTCC
jgi:hypothetical protein